MFASMSGVQQHKRYFSSLAPVALLSSLYESFIRNKTRFGTKFDEFAPLYAEYFANQSVYLNLLQQLYTQGLFQANFLQMNIQFNDNTYVVQKDVAAFPLDAFGAQVGGVLSLWLGVTIMFVFETFEFIINLLYECYRSKRSQKPSSMDVVDTRM